jgi:hypothetical protein
MENINESQARHLVEQFIVRLQANLKTPVKTEYEGQDISPKEKWTIPLIDSLNDVIKDLDSDKTLVVKSYEENFSYQDAEWFLEDLMKELSEDLDTHASIRCSDDQYSDPQEWWLSPIVQGVKMLK